MRTLVIAAAILCLSMATINHFDLLSLEDIEMEVPDQEETPALSSALGDSNQWESFNTWQCFSTENVQSDCTELDYGALRVPTLRISEGTTMYDFTLDPEPNLNCEQTLSKWVELLKNQRSFCIFAAHLQKYQDNPFESDGIEEWHLWIVDQIKTYNGYWKWTESEYESATDREPAESGDIEE